MYRAFDSVLLLARGGVVVFDGPTSAASKHFDSLGYQMAPGSNPADYILDSVSGALDRGGSGVYESDHPAGTPSPGSSAEELGRAWAGSAGGRAALQAGGGGDALEFGLGSLQRMPGRGSGPGGGGGGRFVRRQTPGWGWQSWVFFRRECALYQRSIRTLMIDLVLVVLGATFLGAASINMDLDGAMGVYVLNALVLGLTVMTASTRVFGGAWPVH